VAGSIGGAGRLNFSVIGDSVNVAARVEAHTRETEDQVLITGETRRRLREDCETEPRGEQRLKGIDDPVELHAPRIRDAEVTTAPEPAEPERV
jgi:adenylate cyclase